MIQWALRLVLTPFLVVLGWCLTWFGAQALDALWDWFGERRHPEPAPQARCPWPDCDRPAPHG